MNICTNILKVSLNKQEVTKLKDNLKVVIVTNNTAKYMQEAKNVLILDPKAKEFTPRERSIFSAAMSVPSDYRILIDEKLKNCDNIIQSIRYINRPDNPRYKVLVAMSSTLTLADLEAALKESNMVGAPDVAYMFDFEHRSKIEAQRILMKLRKAGYTCYEPFYPNWAYPPKAGDPAGKIMSDKLYRAADEIIVLYDHKDKTSFVYTYFTRARKEGRAAYDSNAEHMDAKPISGVVPATEYEFNAEGCQGFRVSKIHMK